MKKTTKRFMSAFAAVALAAVMAFGGIGTSVAQAASVDASKMEAYVDVEEAKALIAEAEAEIEAAIIYAQENYKDAYADAYKKLAEAGTIADAQAALAVAKDAVAAYQIPAEVLEALAAEGADVELLKAEFICAQTDAVEAIDKVNVALGEADTFDEAVAAVENLWPEAVCAYEHLMAVAEEIAPIVEEDLQALYDEYAPQVEAAINEFIAEVEAEIAAIEAAIKAEIEKQIAELEKAIEELEAAIKAEIEAIEAELQAKLAELEAMLKEAEEAVKAEIEAAIEAVEEILAEIEAVKADIEAAVDEAIVVIETAVEDIEAAIEDIDATIAELEAAIEAAYAEAMAALEAAYLAAVTGEYVVDKDSYYYALGDSVLLGESTYADKVAAVLAEEYGVEAAGKQVLDGFRAEDMRYLLDASYELDAYGVAETKDAADELRADVIAEIEKADFITVSLGNDNFTSFVAAQFPSAKYEMDWASIVTEEGIPYVEAALAEAVAEMATGDAATDKLMADLVESYAYAFAGFATNYTEVINEIHAINPEAEVVVTGMFNPIDALTVEGENIGEYVDYFIDLSNTMFTIYAMVTPNTTFVAIPDAEAYIDAAELDYVDYFAAILSADESLLPTEAGHAYIADQILGAETITVVEEVAGLKGDVDCDGDVDDTDVNLLYRYVNDYYDDLSEQGIKNADVDGNNVVNDTDVNLVYRYVNDYLEEL